jgi:hypothetical protein
MEEGRLFIGGIRACFRARRLRRLTRGAGHSCARVKQRDRVTHFCVIQKCVINNPLNSVANWQRRTRRSHHQGRWLRSDHRGNCELRNVSLITNWESVSELYAQMTETPFLGTYDQEIKIGFKTASLH